MSLPEFTEGDRVIGLAAYPDYDSELVEGVVLGDNYQVGYIRPDLVVVRADRECRSVIRRTATLVEDGDTERAASTARDYAEMTTEEAGYLGALDNEEVVAVLRASAKADWGPTAEGSGVPLRAFVTKSTGEKAAFANGGVRDTEVGKPRFDLLRPTTVPYADSMLTRFAALMARGAEKYSSRNWEQFSDAEALQRARSSAARHFEQWLCGERDEDHAAAVYFNIMAAEYITGVLSGLWPALEGEES
jgi:hypothetical protein